MYPVVPVFVPEGILQASIGERVAQYRIVEFETSAVTPIRMSALNTLLGNLSA